MQKKETGKETIIIARLQIREEKLKDSALIVILFIMCNYLLLYIYKV